MCLHRGILENQRSSTLLKVEPRKLRRCSTCMPGKQHIIKQQMNNKNIYRNERLLRDIEQTYIALEIGGLVRNQTDLKG